MLSERRKRLGACGVEGEKKCCGHQPKTVTATRRQYNPNLLEGHLTQFSVGAGGLEDVA